MILLIFPLGKELKYFKKCLENKSAKFTSTEFNNTKLWHHESRAWLLATGGHGKVQFGLSTLELVRNFPEISAILCLGSAGALTKDLVPGNIIVGEITIEHDFKSRFENEPNLPSFKGDNDLIEKLDINPKGNTKVKRGIIASGDEDIVSEERAFELHELTLASAVAWEGAGGARAALKAQLPYLEVRAITDSADNFVKEDFFKNLSEAMENLANFLDKSNL